MIQILLAFTLAGHASTGNVKRGREIAEKGTAAGATSCVGCHGANGEGHRDAVYPRLAHQNESYLLAQLGDYVANDRKNAIMGPITKALTVEERADLSAYYASFPAVWGIKRTSPEVSRGERLATIGDQESQVTACNSCHGPGGIGLGPAIPYLAGQYAAYIKAQLEAWKSGTRKNSLTQMAPVAMQLSAQDIDAVAAYYAQVSRPKN